MFIPETAKERADLYIALRAQIAQLSSEARELSKQFRDGRTEGTFKDVRVWMAQPGFKTYRAKGGRRVAIVDKLKPKNEKQGGQQK